MSNIVANIFHLICQAICGENEWQNLRENLLTSAWKCTDEFFSFSLFVCFAVCYTATMIWWNKDIYNSTLVKRVEGVKRANRASPCRKYEHEWTWSGRLRGANADRLSTVQRVVYHASAEVNGACYALSNARACSVWTAALLPSTRS